VVSLGFALEPFDMLNYRIWKKHVNFPCAAPKDRSENYAVNLFSADGEFRYFPAHRRSQDRASFELMNEWRAQQLHALAAERKLTSPQGLSQPKPNNADT
jgi:hypothetical protein